MRTKGSGSSQSCGMTATRWSVAYVGAWCAKTTTTTTTTITTTTKAIGGLVEREAAERERHRRREGEQ